MRRYSARTVLYCIVYFPQILKQVKEERVVWMILYCSPIDSSIFPLGADRRRWMQEESIQLLRPLLQYRSVLFLRSLQWKTYNAGVQAIPPVSIVSCKRCNKPFVVTKKLMYVSIVRLACHVIVVPLVGGDGS